MYTWLDEVTVSIHYCLCNVIEYYIHPASLIEQFEVL